MGVRVAEPNKRAGLRHWNLRAAQPMKWRRLVQSVQVNCALPQRAVGFLRGISKRVATWAQVSGGNDPDQTCHDRFAVTSDRGRKSM